MCWVGKITGFRIAFKDVPVIKVCYKHSEISFWSNARLYLYILNETEKSKIGITYFGRRRLEISEGLHSYEASAFWKNWAEYYNVKHRIDPPNFRDKRKSYLVGFIPKGSIYFINKSGEIVSNKLKLVWDLSTPVKKSGD